MKRSRKIYLLTLLTILIPAAAPAMPWSWDMFTQPSHKAQTEAALPFPEGTVSTKGSISLKDRDEAAKLKNIVPPTPKSIERGKFLYDVYCATCHGETGVGNGIVGQKFVPPADLTSDYVQTKTDGDIYYTITNGGLAIMPMQGDAILPDDRWNVVNYIKHVLSLKK